MDPVTLVHFVVSTTIHLHSIQTLRELCRELELPGNRSTPPTELLDHLIGTLGSQLSEAEASAVHERFAEALKKRSRPRAKSADPSADTLDVELEEAAEPLPPAPRLLQQVARREASFLAGEVHAGDALNEEEDPRSLEIATLSLSNHTTSLIPRVVCQLTFANRKARFANHQVEDFDPGLFILWFFRFAAPPGRGCKP
jgi:hypothetical protein